MIVSKTRQLEVLGKAVPSDSSVATGEAFLSDHVKGRTETTIEPATN